MQIKVVVPVKLIKDYGVLIIRILSHYYVIIILQMKKFHESVVSRRDQLCTEYGL
jgi:hypothetical protein